jgi:hypothetical protein
MVRDRGDLDHARAMTTALTKLRLWLALARPPLFAVALGVGVGVMRGSAVVAGAVAGIAILAIVGWREYWRPSSWLVEGDR